MQQFADRIAVITGGGSGIGRELAVQLASESCHLAVCDLSQQGLDETQQRCRETAPASCRISTYVADVASQSEMDQFRDHICATHQTDHVHLLFNNAGIGGGGSFIDGDREEWERTFNVCWGGVYHASRALVPLLVAAEEGHLINISSVNGFWASLGPDTPHTAYSAAKFAVKGFTEALINDFKVNAPHVRCSVVMPGHIGTNITVNSKRVHGRPEALDMSDEDAENARDWLTSRGLDAESMSLDEVRQTLHDRDAGFRDRAPTSAAEAAAEILEAVRQERWRVLVGDDARAMDQVVRSEPETAYEKTFLDTIMEFQRSDK